MKRTPIAALEIGSTRTVVLVGAMDDDGFINVDGIGHSVSTSVHKGQVTDINNAASGAQRAIEQVLSIADINSVNIAISGGSIGVVRSVGSTPLASHNHSVTDDDIEYVKDNAQEFVVPQDHGILHVFEQDYSIDDQNGIVNPYGLKGSKLSLNSLAVHAKASVVENLKAAAQACNINVASVAFSAYCASLSVLTREQKHSGVLLIDMGGGTTDYVFYKNGFLITAGSIAVGGDHVTADIAQAFNIPYINAEEIKKSYGNALLGGGNERISVKGDFGFGDRNISVRNLRIVINARIDEIFKIIRSDLVAQNLYAGLQAGVILVGGAASLGGITQYAENIFNLSCVIGMPNNVRGLENETAPHTLATAAGLLIYGHEQMQNDRRASSWFRRLFQ